MNTCKQKYVSHVLKTHAAEVSCARDQIMPILDTAHYPDRDLVDMALAKRLVVAEQQDQHKLSPGQAAVQSAQIKVDLMQALEQRKAVRQQTAAVQAQARAQIASVQQQRLSDQQRLAAQQAQAQAVLQAQQDEARHERSFALLQQGLNMMANSGPHYVMTAPEPPGYNTLRCSPDGGGYSTCISQ